VVTFRPGPRIGTWACAMQEPRLIIGEVESLRPMTFHYKRPFADGSKPIQYGLIAEEVAEVYPDLVAYSGDARLRRSSIRCWSRYC
jgi:hypothetical protein